MSVGPLSPRRSWVEQIMGMPISVLARGEAAGSELAERASAAAFAELRAVDAMFSTYRPDSAVSRLGRGEITLGQCPPQVRDVERGCARARELTNGLFDATRPDGRWDPSGFVKGWAAQRCARHLAAVPQVDWCLNAGGDVIVLCAHGRTFQVGIADPQDATRIAAVLECGTGAVATSGTSVRGSHIYDPRTGRAAEPHWASVSVAGPSLETADVLATAAFAAGPSWAEVLALAADYAGLAITTDGATTTTEDWPTTTRPRGTR